MSQINDPLAKAPKPFDRSVMVIAWFSKPKAVSYLIAGLFIVGLLFIVTLYHPSGTSLVAYTRSRGEFWLLVYPLGWLAGIAAFLMLIALLKQLAFMRANAVWIENGRIVYLNKWFMAVRRSDIKSIAVGSWGTWRRPGIILTLRNGQKKVIPTGILSEPSDVVLSRLKVTN